MNYSTLPVKEIERLARRIPPGGWAVETERPLSTMLGSCVAVCLYDPQSRIGGLNHFMLPTLEHVQFEDADALLSGEFAMQALLEAVLERGAHKGSLQAKAFGGGTIFDTPGQSITIGLLNTAFTKAWLRREAIPLLASDLLGPWSRTVLFLPASGEVFCRRRVTNMATAEVIARETRAYKQTLVVRPSVTTSPTSGLDHG